MYSKSFKESLVVKLLPPLSRDTASVAAESGVPKSTLSRWRLEAGRLGTMAKTSGKKWSAAEKLRVVVEAGQLTGSELGEFLRREGLHAEKVAEWRAAAAAALEEGPRPSGGPTPDVRRIKELEQELRRKDAALAETAALLVLKKKADSIWGAADDDTPRKSARRP